MKVFANRFLEKLARPSALALCCLLASATAACGSEGSGGGGAPETPSTSVPAPLAADWYTGTISSVNFFNPTTGSWGSPSGTGMFFKFAQDGHYEKGFLMQSSLYGCTMSFLAYSRGTMTVSGDRIVIYPTYGRIKSVDNCVTENNYERADQLGSETMLWELGRDEFGSDTLWLRYEGGNPSAFHRG